MTTSPVDSLNLSPDLSPNPEHLKQLAKADADAAAAREKLAVIGKANADLAPAETALAAAEAALRGFLFEDAVNPTEDPAAEKARLGAAVREARERAASVQASTAGADAARSDLVKAEDRRAGLISTIIGDVGDRLSVAYRAHAAAAMFYEAAIQGLSNWAAWEGNEPARADRGNLINRFRLATQRFDGNPAGAAKEAALQAALADYSRTWRATPKDLPSGLAEIPHPEVVAAAQAEVMPIPTVPPGHRIDPAILFERPATAAAE